MKKIPSLFKRDYEATRLIYDEVVPGCEWVLDGEGTATIKLDGTSCAIIEGKLYKRYDRKINKPAPSGWIPCEDEPNEHTGHWPGWMPVGDGPEDKYHREAFDSLIDKVDGTYELIGPKVQGDPYKMRCHLLVPHGQHELRPLFRSFSYLRNYLSNLSIEGIVFHRGNGDMCKVKRTDFGLPWPIKDGGEL